MFTVAIVKPYDSLFPYTIDELKGKSCVYFYTTKGKTQSHTVWFGLSQNLFLINDSEINIG